MPFTTSTAQKIINMILRNTAFTQPSTVYISLHTADPGDTGANEVSGGSYARKAITFAAPSGKSTSNNVTLEWTNMPACTVTHIGLWDAQTGGTLWWTGQLTASKTLQAGDAFRIDSGALTVTLT